MVLIENEIILRLLNAGNGKERFVRLHSQILTKLGRCGGDTVLQTVQVRFPQRKTGENFKVVFWDRRKGHSWQKIMPEKEECHGT